MSLVGVFNLAVPFAILIGGSIGLFALIILIFTIIEKHPPKDRGLHDE